ncbi:carbon-nitrogen hydrolase family protein [Rhizobium paknamense]|uniref:Amidohydrolase n=1 Tax=Rhizobium paknamense TaxID=1206817 RepID=A0ABU0I7Y1_9HYPH|nr:carbon-nitrogen hydrolase family protein [Rhizobium paknamense]MDQ0454345.1 putative amidohydrolase [Rhizobium paknamense]
MSTSFLRIALAQVMHTCDPDRVCAAAAAKAAEIVVFPEMFSNGYSRFAPESKASRQAWTEEAVSMDGAYLDRFRKAARDHGLAVVATFLEQGCPKPFNSAVLINQGGDIILHQRKRHICFFDIPEEACAPGDSSHVVKLATSAGDIAIGIMICMDREFPDAGSDLVKGGADIILVPNSSPLIEDPSVGDVRVAGVRALAFQSATAIAVANYPQPKDDGHSFAVNALGKVIGMASTKDEIFTVDIDIDELRRIQTQEWFRRVR